ncbi:baculoviral IAP repeat-containing protein 3-like isoform X2 [Ruditapes philippinarum]|uniref:baculoviral IAP repeat-containing protein 3-like isoform X2 n=1 Tax=Ruditapes philippinarum TaxID=129788 RepID=UPI00295BBE2F|nr:baculoviral IAP repeat-containing protein 3-like isoform X2 [Ruditapes philippinarum]
MSSSQPSLNNSTLAAQQSTNEHQTQAGNEISHEEQTSSEQHATFVQQSSVQQTLSQQHTTSEQQTTTLSSNTTHSFEPMMTVINKIADGQRVPPQTTMKYEMLRFCTLRSFPKGNKPYITRLAGAGFYYANEGDEVVCYCCARRRRNWTEFENPLEVHRELNPNCSFLIRNSEVNVSVRQSIESSTAESHSNLTTINRGQSNTNFRNELTEVNVSSAVVTGSQIQTNQNSENSSFASNVLSSRGGNQSVSLLPVDVPQTTIENQSSNNSTGNVSSSVTPKYPNYVSTTSRLSSFNDCGDIVIPPDRLAQAGFFYAGFGDCVRCFQCGVGLRHWSEEDDPWIEHSRWSNECSYVRQIRGREFVNIVQMAVQYSQNQTENETISTQGTEGIGRGSGNASADIDRLMHTNAAQSVLEMGYHPDVIRRAIRMVLSSTGHGILTATNVMEKIFEIEDSESQENTAPENAALRAPANTEARAPANVEARASANAEALAPANAESRQSNNETFTTTTQEIQGLGNRHESTTPQNTPLKNVSGAVARGNKKLLNNGSSENQQETATRHNDDDKTCSGNVNGDESQGRQQNVSTMSSGGSKREISKQTTSPASRKKFLF